jgi:CMP-N,N'-diacetyllegionaminic acid synthase
MKHKIIAIIPARAGSRSVPNKNIRNFAGKRLYHWTVEAALDSKAFTQIVVSTNDQTILNERYLENKSLQYISRPPEISHDTSVASEYVEHVLHAINENFEYICVLQPTSPLRTAEHINDLVVKTTRSELDYGVTVTHVPHQFSPTSLLQKIDDSVCEMRHSIKQQRFRRQEKEMYLARNGAAIYICKTKSFLKNRTLVGKKSIFLEMDALSSVDIDTEDDFKLAELIMRNKLCVE